MAKGATLYWPSPGQQLSKRRKWRRQGDMLLYWGCTQTYNTSPTRHLHVICCCWARAQKGTNGHIRRYMFCAEIWSSHQGSQGLLMFLHPFAPVSIPGTRLALLPWYPKPRTRPKRYKVLLDCLALRVCALVYDNVSSCDAC